MQAENRKEWLAILRERKNLRSTGALAEAVGRCRVTVSRWANGRTTPGPEDMAALARLAETSVEEVEGIFAA